MINQSQIIEETIEFVKEKLSSDSTGHDWWHIYRVHKISKYLAKKEGADQFIVEIASLLHDIADWKFNDGDENEGPKVARSWLEKYDLEDETVERITNIIKRVSYKGKNVRNEIQTLEGMVVQDADRLDAIGAIGIARTFAYGGYKGNPIHDPELKPIEHNSFEEYKSSKGTTINHFYEKLLLLKDLMNTKTAKELAEKRHKIMKEFLSDFFEEWEVNIKN